ncbi:TRAP transporter permease [Corynebacterium kozikiae]|uniref:TRAP transporter permease n=1 Tax=Corynebacterium kozikiae TaxID=2968469 RepID=UPI00211D06AF|nr:TRAP transporter permease [Corynebacterium sp. 76QC2CO]MCQ9343009.1 TRAP transporter permease [Corynebacterium sp. 76QC2CO]
MNTATNQVLQKHAPSVEMQSPARLTPLWKMVIGALTLLGILIAINQVFFLELAGFSIPTNSFLYLIAGTFLPIVFLAYPASKKHQQNSDRTGVPWYDVLLAAALFCLSFWFATQGPSISKYGWSMVAPLSATIGSIAFWAFALEILRRTAGKIVAILALIVSLYPLVAATVPINVLRGISYDFLTLAQIHTMGSESILGLPFQTAATILIGFLLFGVALQHTGGADFFNNLANSLFGHFRGGSAKVSVTSSAAMGMMSGSAVSNVLTTGPMTIPTMIRSGFSRVTAGAIEATASSGGSITPPIMGTAAFLMVSFVGVPYTEILIAASIPAFLYYFGIYMQIDGYAAVRQLHGEPKERLPKVGSTLKQGWPFVLAIATLTLLLLVTPTEAQVPFWIVALLVLIAILLPKRSFGWAEAGELILDAGKTIAQILGIIVGVGLILGGLSATGVALSISRDLVVLVGDNVLLILIAGALACFILGTGLTISAAYVFLAIVMVPALTALGINPIAAHLFVIYWASVSYITPPVGLAAFAAAGISKASPMATCVEAMKFGAVKYVMPFAFVLNPALVAQDSPAKIGIAAAASIVSVFALSSMFSGYLQFVETRITWPIRAILGVGGTLIFLPQASLSLAGLGLIIAAFVIAIALKKRMPETKTPEPDEVALETQPV